MAPLWIASAQCSPSQWMRYEDFERIFSHRQIYCLCHFPLFFLSMKIKDKNSLTQSAFDLQCEHRIINLVGNNLKLMWSEQTIPFDRWKELKPFRGQCILVAVISSTDLARLIYRPLLVPARTTSGRADHHWNAVFLSNKPFLLSSPRISLLLKYTNLGGCFNEKIALKRVRQPANAQSVYALIGHTEKLEFKGNSNFWPANETRFQNETKKTFWKASSMGDGLRSKAEMNWMKTKRSYFFISKKIRSFFLHN